MKNYKYYDLILGAYVCVLLCSNLIGPAKVSTVQVPLVGPVTFMAGVLFFLTLPAWMVIEQAICGVLLFGAAIAAFRS